MIVTQILAIYPSCNRIVFILFQFCYYITFWHMLLQISDVLAAHFGLWVNSKTANEEFRQRGGGDVLLSRTL